MWILALFSGSGRWKRVRGYCNMTARESPWEQNGLPPMVNIMRITSAKSWSVRGAFHQSAGQILDTEIRKNREFVKCLQCSSSLFGWLVQKKSTKRYLTFPICFLRYDNSMSNRTVFVPFSLTKNQKQLLEKQIIFNFYY